VNSALELGDIVSDEGSTDTGVAFDLKIVSNGEDDSLNLLSELTSGGQNEGLALLQTEVELLEDTDGESGSLSSSRLSLGDEILSL